jgi:hemoglobin/transferrin/lactoferrin receptor protein
MNIGHQILSKRNCAALLLPLAFSLNSMAADGVTAELEEATLTGKQAEEQSFFVDSANNVSDEELDQWAASDLNDIFKNAISVSAGGRSQTQDIYIRGLQSTLGNVTVDGAPQVGAIFYHAGTGGAIEPELLKAVNVSAGTGNALSGAGALGGSIAYETKDGFDMLREGESIGGQIKGTYYSSGEGGYKANIMGYGLINEDWSYLVSLGHSDMGNYDDGDGNEVVNSEYERDSAFLKASGHITDSQSLSISYEYLEDEGAGGIAMNKATTPSDDVNSQRRDTVNVHYDINPIDNDLVNIESNAYYTKRTLEATGREEMNISSIGYDLRNTSEFETLKITYGTDYRQDTYKNTGDGEEAENNVIGLYAQGDLKLSEALTVSAGVRWDRYDADAYDGTNVEQDGFSPNLTAILTPIEGLKLRATYAEAIRGYQPNQPILDTVTVDPSADYERSRNLEFGAEYEFGRYYVGATVYKLTIDDLLEMSSKTNAITNYADYENVGYEIVLGAKFENLDLRAGVTENDPEATFFADDSTSNSNTLLNSKIGRSWFANAEYKFDDLNLTLGWRVDYVESTTADSRNGPSEKKSYVVHDAFARWQPSQIDSLSVNLTVANIFDKFYYDHSSFGTFFPESGREVSLALTYQF